MYSLKQTDKDRPTMLGRLGEIFLMNQQAVLFMEDMHFISHVWDDLVDGDKPVSREAVSAAFEKAMISVNMNPWFRQNAALLLPVMLNSSLLWHAANDLEADGSPHALQVAHVIRCAPGDLALMCAAIIGGTSHAKKHAAELRMMMQQDSLEDYLRDMGVGDHAQSA
ncbi:MAG: hypothetical protein KF686_03315 [Ramlibacter sp.]|nr:hypothetical protein [Ramlibacter sp.]